MNKSIRLVIALAVVLTATTACKTKQKVTEVPAGATTEAVAPKTTNATESTTAAKVNTPVQEVTRNENFSLAAGETNADALKFKYHVVVGSFSKIENAKGLQATLKSEGNNPVIVVNEKGMYRLLINSYNDYNQAHARIKEISNRFIDAWVLVKK